MKSNRMLPQASITLTVTSLLAILVLFAPPPVAAQTDCASIDRCDQLRVRLQDSRHEARGVRRELRQLRRELAALPQDSPERERIREQIRESRHELHSLKRELRPIRQDIRQHCRGCFAGDPNSGFQ